MSKWQTDYTRDTLRSTSPLVQAYIQAYIHWEHDLGIQAVEDEALCKAVAAVGGRGTTTAPWLSASEPGCRLAGEADDGPVPSRVSSFSIMRDTAAIPALTSLLISEPRFDMVLFCVNHLSFHPRVLFVMESLYLVLLMRMRSVYGYVSQVMV